MGAIQKGESMIGGGSLPTESLPTYLFCLEVANPNQFHKFLRTPPSPVISRVDNNQVLFDPRTVRVEEEKPLKVYYDGLVVGDFYVDLFVNEAVVVELKSVQSLLKEHEVQLVNYLNGLKKDIGLLINFGPSGVEVKRKYRKPAQEGMDSVL